MKVKFDKLLWKVREKDWWEWEAISFDWEYTTPTWVVSWNTVQQFIDLHFESVNPTLSISVSPYNSLREYWDDVTNPTINSTFNSWSNPTSPVSNFEYKRDATIIHDGTTDDSFQDSFVVSNRTIYKVTATDWEWRVVSNSKTYSFVYPFFWGVCPTWSIYDWITENDLVNISWVWKNITTKWNKSVTGSPNSERFVFLYPESYWNLSSIIDDNWFETISDYNVSVISITSMLDWTNVNYKFYELKSDTTQTDFTNQFNY